MEQSAKPHDKFFRLVFSTPEAQQDLISLALPPEITNTFRMETVKCVLQLVYN